MAENAAEPTLVDIEENPLPKGGKSGWLYLSRGKVWLRAAYWPAAVDEPEGTIVLATGRAEFIEKYFETIEDLLARGFAVAAFDWRGQGGSSRLLRNPAKGHVASFDDYVDDLEAAVAGAAAQGLPRPFYLLAHSMGATVALLGASRLADQIERMVLAAPLIEFADRRASSPWAKTVGGLAAGIGLARRSVRPGRAPAPQDMPFDSNPVTSDQRRFARAQAVLRTEPRLGLGAPTIRWYAAANRATRALTEPGYGEEIKIPTLVVACGTDEVVSVRAIERFAKTLRAGGRVFIPGARHEILMERTAFRTLFWAAFDAFVPGSDLRLATDIAAPKVKIAPPAKANGAPAAAGVALAPAATEAEDAEGSAVKTATAEAPSPETASSEAIADAVEAGKTLEADDKTPEIGPSAEVQSARKAEAGPDADTASETGTSALAGSDPARQTEPAEPLAAATEDPVALAPAAPDAAESERQGFSFFRWRRRTQPRAATPGADSGNGADNVPANGTDDMAAAPVATDPPASPEDTASKPDPDHVSAEAALVAATSLIAEATRGDQPGERSSDASEPASRDAGGTTDAPGPEAGSTGAGDAAAADDATVTGKRNGRVGRLFRRRGNGSDIANISAAEDQLPSEAAPASVTPDDLPETGAPAEPVTPVAAADSSSEPGSIHPAQSQNDGEAETTTATISFATAAPSTDEPVPAATDSDGRGQVDTPGDAATSAERETRVGATGEAGTEATIDARSAEPDAAGTPAAAQPDSAIRSRRSIGEAARPTPRPVKRGRGKSGKR